MSNLVDDLWQNDVNELGRCRSALVTLTEAARRHVYKGHNDTCSHMVVQSTPCDCGWNEADMMIATGGALTADYVSGDVACGLAFDLGAAQAKVEGVWGVLADRLADGAGTDDPTLQSLLEMVGLKRWRRLVTSIERATDDELRAECRRRGIVTMSPESPAGIHQHNVEVADRIDAELRDRLAAEAFARRRFHAFVQNSAGPGGEYMRCAECGMPRDSAAHATF